MSNNHYSIIVNIPLEEELRAFQGVFPYIADKSTDHQYRCEVSTDSEITMLVVLQDEMGKSSASNSITEVLQDYTSDLIICLGIAGGLTKDLKLGDVCYSGNIIDVYDNSKTKDGDGGSISLELSPYSYRTDKRLSLAMDFIRRSPDLAPLYIEWCDKRCERARELGIQKIDDIKNEKKHDPKPHSMSGSIVCGAVSAGNNYNDKLRQIDRKIAAIETESGGVFNVATRRGIRALTIRGISDYADAAKAKLEDETKDAVRVLAAENAASFLKLQLQNSRFVQLVKDVASSNSSALTANGTKQKHSIEDIVLSSQDYIDSKLRTLSPEFRLHVKGYQMPMPSLLSEAS